MIEARPSTDLLRALFTLKRVSRSPKSMAEWFQGFNDSVRDYDSSLDRAILGGRMSRDVGHAFVSGYQSALERLFGMESPMLASLCVSERGGNHPRAIETRLSTDGDRFVLNGHKQFVSGAEDSQQLFVAATTGTSSEGYPTLKLVRVDARQSGVNVRPMPPLGFVPEISHGTVTLQDVRIAPDQVLPGDGYLQYIKPFRTLEDLHVLAALAAFRMGEAIESNWDKTEQALHLPPLLALRQLNTMPINAPETHLALFACREQMNVLFAATDDQYRQRNPEGFKRWERDRKLLDIAGKAQNQRTQKAWKAVVA